MILLNKTKISFLVFNIVISSIFIFINLFFIDISYIKGNTQKNVYYIILKINFYTISFISFLIINYVLYLILYKFPKIFKIIIFVLLLLTFITGYYSLKYQINIDDAFIINIIHEITNAKTIISLSDILIIGVFILLLIYVLLKFNFKKEKFNIINIFKPIYLLNSFKKYAIILFIISIISFASIITFKHLYSVLFNTYKGLNKTIKKEIAHNIYYYKYVYILQNIIDYYKKTPSNEEIMSTIKQGDVYLNKKFRNITTIFLMSDSIRAQSMSLFGFNLKTNPNLQKLYNNKEIYLFKQNVCYTSTLVSLNCMLSLMKAEKFRELKSYYYAKEKITKYFNYLNIDTYYLANNEVNAIYSGYKYVPINATSPVLDKDVLPYLYQSLNKNNQFITVNLRGAHTPYDLMLEKEFKKFIPENQTENEINKSNYHNKVLQTDFVWNEIINQLSKLNKPVFIILTADHGQSFGEIYNGKYFLLHSAEMSVAPPQQTQTPLIIYVNDAYKKLYPNYVKNIKNNMKKYQGKLIKSDMISHSLLHCSGIEGNVINTSLSLCSDK